MKKLRWGILGTGSIANRFANDLKTYDGAVLAAVGSRAPETAAAFGAAHGIGAENCFGSYEALAASPEVDIVYVASPHSHHAEHMTQMLEAGKHVLCEKAFTLNACEARRVFALARKKGLFAAEAMWTRFLPANRALSALLADGALGELTTANAFFGNHFPDEWPLTHRIYNPLLGGGALLDMGVYAVSFLSMLAGDAAPERLSAMGTRFEPTGVDDRSVLTMIYPNGLMSVAGCAIKAQMRPDGFVSGSLGKISVPSFWKAEAFAVELRGKAAEERRYPLAMGALAYEAASVTEDILAGRTESSVMPQRATLRVMELLDYARGALGCRYAADEGICLGEGACRPC